jgi:cyclic-di-AMP phosphodiesterase PgpH
MNLCPFRGMSRYDIEDILMKNRGTSGGKGSGGKNASKTSTRESLQQRSKYIDQSLEFLDWVNRLGLEKTIVGRIAQELDERFRLRRILLLFLFSLGLSFLLAFDFDFTYQYQPGDLAQNDIKSPIGFQFVDEVSTAELRDQAAKKIPPVFDFDRNVFEDTFNRTYRAFRKMRDEVRKVHWAKTELEFEDQVRDFFRHKPTFEEILARPISEREFEWLVIKKFNAQIENALVAILERWSQYRIIDSFDKEMPLGLRELNVRDVQGNSFSTEYVIAMRDVHDLAHEEDFLVDQGAFPKDISRNDQTMLSILARSMVVPNIKLNKVDTTERRRKAKDEIIPDKKLIEKNQIIVHEGAKVREIDATIMREIENQRSQQHRNFVALICAVLFVVLLLVCFSYVKRFTVNRVVVEAKDIGIMGFVMLLTVSITKMFLFLTNTAFASKYGTMIPDSAIVFLAPVAGGAMLVGLLITAGELVWIFSMILAIVVGFMVEDYKFQFFLVSIAGSIAGASGVFNCKKRNDIYLAGIRTGAVNALMIALVLTVQQFSAEDYMKQLIWSVPAGFLSGLGSAMVAMMIVPVLETVFNCTTDVKLLELSNLNHPLMKEMIVKRARHLSSLFSRWFNG